VVGTAGSAARTQEHTLPGPGADAVAAFLAQSTRPNEKVFTQHALALPKQGNQVPTSGLLFLDWAHQWAADSLRILFWDNPLFRPGLSWLQRFQYAHLGLVYLYAGFVMPLFYVLPIIALFTGSYVMSTTWWMYALVRLPSFVVISLAYQAQYAIARSEISFGRASNVWLGYFPAFIAATAVALTHPRRKPPYTVTGMGPSRRSIAERIVGTLPQWTLIALSLLSIPYALLRHAGGELDMVLVNAAWALWTVEKLWWICLGAMTGASQQS
jgi:hypothetical protein